jgi:GntR family transcriptional regulator / MocR family aminotransferase
MTAGTRLPSSRFLARELGLSRLTVVSTNDQLVAGCYLESRHGSGTFVADVLPPTDIEFRTGARTRREIDAKTVLSRRAASLGTSAGDRGAGKSFDLLGAVR